MQGLDARLRDTARPDTRRPDTRLPHTRLPDRAEALPAPPRLRARTCGCARRSSARPALVLFCASALLPAACAPPERGDAGAQQSVVDAFRVPEDATHVIDAAASALHIFVFRGGLAARAGHNHVLSAPELEGFAVLPGEDVQDARFALHLRLDELQIDDPALRAQAGGAFGGARSAADIEGTRRNMLGPRGLDAAHDPEVLVRSRAIAGDWPVLVATSEIILHGRAVVVDIPLQVERLGTTLRVTGETALRQSDFGVQPFSVLGGLLAVQDALVVRFDLQLRAVSDPR